MIKVVQIESTQEIRCDYSTKGKIQVMLQECQGKRCLVADQ